MSPKLLPASPSVRSFGCPIFCLFVSIPSFLFFFFLNDPPTPETYPLPLPAALPIWRPCPDPRVAVAAPGSASQQSHRGRRPDSGHRRPETAAHGLDPTAVRRPRGPGPCAGRTPGPRPRREREDELSGSRPARQTRPRSHRDRSPPRPRGESLRESCDPKPARASAAPALSDHRSHRTRNDPDGSKHYRPAMPPGRHPTLTRLSSYFTGNGGAAAS